MLKNLEELIKLIRVERERKKNSPGNSYTKKLNNKNLSTDKVKEEIEELIESKRK